MKKILIGLFSILLILFLTGCGKPTSESGGGGGSSKPTTYQLRFIETSFSPDFFGNFTITDFENTPIEPAKDTESSNGTKWTKEKTYNILIGETVSTNYTNSNKPSNYIGYKFAYDSGDYTSGTNGPCDISRVKKMDSNVLISIDITPLT